MCIIQPAAVTPSSALFEEMLGERLLWKDMTCPSELDSVDAKVAAMFDVVSWLACGLEGQQGVGMQLCEQNCPELVGPLLPWRKWSYC